MKDFFSIEKFKELALIIGLEIIIVFLIFLLIRTENLELDYWDWKAFILSMGVWLLSSVVDKKKCWNLATLIGVGFFAYLSFWIIFNMKI